MTSDEDGEQTQRDHQQLWGPGGLIMIYHYITTYLCIQNLDPYSCPQPHLWLQGLSSLRQERPSSRSSLQLAPIVGSLPPSGYLFLAAVSNWGVPGTKYCFFIKVEWLNDVQGAFENGWNMTKMNLARTSRQIVVHTHTYVYIAYIFTYRHVC